VGFLIGVVDDIETGTQTRGTGGHLGSVGNPLLRLKVEFGMPATADDKVVLQLLEAGHPPVGTEPLEIGERVLITYVNEVPVRSWACGRLRSALSLLGSAALRGSAKRGQR